MRRTLLFLLLVFSLQVVSAQQRDTITISFNNQTLESALQQIESKSNFNFYYLDEWLKNKFVSGNFTNDPITDVLDEILKNTVINYTIVEGSKIILTQNTVIYDTLPDDFFGKEEIDYTDEIDFEQLSDDSPIFVVEENTNNGVVEVVRIGRENRSKGKRNFTLTGRALLRKNNQAVADLAIIVEGKNNGTSTDSNGNYSLELPPGENLVSIRGLGIQSTQTRIVIYNDGNYDFKLDESVELLDEVVVKGNVDRNVKSVIAGITRLEVENLKTIPLVLGERDILKAAVTLPGIANAGEGASGYNVRGGRTDQNLILLDEGIIYNPSHFFGIFSAINPFTSGSVDIFKGHIPSEFGGRLSSVFDIKTKEGNKEKFSGEGSIGPVTGNLVLEMPLAKKKASLLIGGRATYSNWILRSLDDEQLSNSKASFYDVVAKYSHTINENNQVEATGYYSDDEFSITSDSIFNYSNRLVSLKWDHKFNDKTTLDLSAANSEYTFGIAFDGQSNDDFDLGYKNNETEVKLKMKHLGKKHEVTYGVSGKLYQINPGNIDPLGPDSEITPLEIPEERAIEAAAFFSDSYEISDKFLLDAGIRYSFYAALGASSQRLYQENAPRNASTQIGTSEFDKNEVIETYGGPELRVSARYFIAPDFSVKASFNNAYQYIHTLSNNTTVSPTDTWKLSDLNIEPQQAYQTSLGFYKNWEGNKYELSLEGYYKEQENLLDYKVGAQLLLNDNIEQEVLQGDGKAYGVEFLLKKNEGRLNGWIGYTYSRSFVRLDGDFREERVNNGEFFPSNYDKPHDVSVVANYRFTKRFSASTNFVFQTGRPVTFPVGSFEFNNSEFVFYSERNKFRIPDYYRLDVSFNVEGNHKKQKLAHSFWSFSIYNVLGRNNPYSVFFVTENGEIKAYQSSIFAIPIPTLTYNFKF